MANEALGQLFFRELEKIRRQEGWTDFNRVDACYQLLTMVFVEATKQERLRFNTLFSRIAFACQKYQINRSLQFYLHAFRREAADVLQGRSASDKQQILVPLGFRVLAESIAILFKSPIPEAWDDLLRAPWPYAPRPPEIQSFKPHVRVLALADLPQERQFIIKEEEFPEEDHRMQYGLADHNELFTPAIRMVQEVVGFPATLELVDVEIDRQGVYRPRAIVVDPDHLIDVSAIAECFRETGPVPEIYLLKKFLPFETTPALLQGHIANFFLDELLHQTDADFRKTFSRVFQLNPLAFALISDHQIKTLMQDSQRHFANLRQVILRDFPELGISPKECTVEPSFYAQVYGIQGRLDAFFRKETRSAIIELKSGKVFKPNAYGINASHYIQTLLYDLMIRAVFGKLTDPANYILYSGASERPLRFAPVVKAQQYEAMQVRNQLLGAERQLAQLGRNAYCGREDLLRQGMRWLEQLNPGRFGASGNFVVRDAETFWRTVQAADETEKRYFFAFSGFIAREHRLAKTGLEDLESVNGQSALWRHNLEKKESNFEILSHLNIRVNQAAEEPAVLKFVRTERTNRLANFRAGDIAILYPLPPDGKSPLSNQLFKCTITEINAQEIAVQLRARQSNDQIFREQPFWNLEHDLMDISFIGMYRGLFDFLRSAARSRQLLLGRIPPELPDPVSAETPLEMTAEQQGIFRQILSSRDYFLLWGPPGTGKTSVMLKHLTGYWFRHTAETFLILAYTNRAVDEICSAIESFHPAVRDQYLRIGSRFSTAPEFQERLLQVQAEKAATRKELKALLQGQRILVATVAAIASKPELLELKAFDRVVIDEASQIPEPMLAGFLPRFRHFLLVGDHKQLPAVVTQDESASSVEDEALQGLGIQNLRNSLFERLYKRCQSQNWHWAYARLSHQGRMHQEVMEFPNRFFYEGQLKILPESSRGYLPQVRKNILPLPEQDHQSVFRLLATYRMLFIPTPSDESSPMQKTNRYEAQMAVKLVAAYQRLFELGGNAFHSNRLGIITPYRAQIAQIRHTLEETGIDPDSITIDTVERYQGGARDVIILSLCTNSITQMRALVSLSEEGIDRKLNVALTRARESVVILGNPELLERNPIYKALISACATIDFP